MSPVSKESTETISLSSSVSSFADVAPRYFEHWHDLLDACTDYARASGWRYTPVDFMRELDVGGAERAGVACRAASTTVVLDWAERVAAVAREQTEGAAECDLGEWAQRLLEEFRLCERLVAQEAVFNSMLSTCRALGLCKPNAAISTAAAGSMVGSLAGVDGCAWQDMSVSLEHVARRLDNFVLMIEREPRIKAQRSDRLLQANFVVEFGLAHGLRENGDKVSQTPHFCHLSRPRFCHMSEMDSSFDQTAEAMLRDFLERVKEWGGIDPSSTELVKALVLDAIPERGLASQQLRDATLRWFDENQNTALALGLVLGGISGLLLAGVAAAVRSSTRR